MGPELLLTTLLESPPLIRRSAREYVGALVRLALKQRFKNFEITIIMSQSKLVFSLILLRAYHYWSNHHINNNSRIINFFQNLKCHGTTSNDTACLHVSS